MPQPYMLIPRQGSSQADEWIQLGVEAQMAGKLPDAERQYRNALRLDPANPVATQNLAVVFAQAGNLNEALITIERASMLDGQHGVIHMNRGLMALECDRVDEAVIEATKAVELSPGPETKAALAMALTSAGQPRRAVELYNEVLAQNPRHPNAGLNACFVQTLGDFTPQELLEQRRKWREQNAFTGAVAAHQNDFSGKTRALRVGYVSGDFKMHSAAMIFSQVLLGHERTKVEPYFYSTLALNAAADEYTKLFLAAAEGRWRDITALNDQQADAQIRQDRIDILVDLAGHTNGGRLSLFLRRPAPVQVTAWGFAHGTGLPEIDYFFADAVAVPEGERKFYAEKIWDLPCIVTYRPPENYRLNGSSPLPLHQNGCVTLGSYSRFEKLSDDCLRCFGEILERLPEARLQFKDHGFRRPSSIRRVRSALGKIKPERLLFSISTNHQDHLLAHQQADLALDPFPHGGGVVALEQLYMGVPLVTLYGRQPSWRTASSVLTAMGRPDWIARSQEEYVEKAVALASDVSALQSARRTLRQEFLKSPVVAGYREAVEGAYASMWKERCQRG